MIRNVVLARIADDAGPEEEAQLARGLAGIAALRLPGQLAVHVGRDAGLRAGAWSCAITSDWTDEDAYRAYDLDPEHNVYRELVVAVSAEVARKQIVIPDD